MSMQCSMPELFMMLTASTPFHLQVLFNDVAAAEGQFRAAAAAMQSTATSPTSKVIWISTIGASIKVSGLVLPVSARCLASTASPSAQHVVYDASAAYSGIIAVPWGTLVCLTYRLTCCGLLLCCLQGSTCMTCICVSTVRCCLLLS